MSRLIQDYKQFEMLFVADADGSLTETQKAVLVLLHLDLMRVCLNHACTDVALRCSDVWRRVRQLARSALLAFNWPMGLPLKVEPM